MRKVSVRFTAAVCIATLLGSAMLTGCGTGTAQIQTEKVVEFTDSCGRKVEVPKHITSVVASGSLAQIALYAIDPDALIGLSGGWSDDAQQYIKKKYLDLPTVGQFFGQHDLNYEEITDLNPQIVIDVGENKDTMEEDLDDITDKTGIPTVHIDAYMNDMGTTFRTLGKLLGKEEEGEKLAEYSEAAYKEAKSVAKQAKKKGEIKSLLYCVGENGQNVIAKDSYHSEIVDLLSDNKAVIKSPSSKGSGNAVDIEQITNWNPQVILFGADGYYSSVQDDDTWSGLQAIKNGTYYEVPNGPYNWMGSPPSSNRILGMLWMAKLLYPDIATYDLEKKAKEYYKLFYHSDLTDAQYKALVANSVLKK